jgi:hypothetical protein
MEGFIDVSKSVINRPASQFTQETEIRTEHATIDRHGIAARFLRLAFRINMEQLKLVSQDPPPVPEPLSAEELAEQEAASAAILAEFEAVERAAAEAAEADRLRVAEEQRVAAEMAEEERRARERVAELIASESQAAEGTAEAVAESAAVADDRSSAADQADAAIQPVNKMNTRRAAKADVSVAGACGCAGDAERDEIPSGMQPGPLLTPPLTDSPFAFT